MSLSHIIFMTPFLSGYSLNNKSILKESINSSIKSLSLGINSFFDVAWEKEIIYIYVECVPVHYFWCAKWYAVVLI